MDKRMYYSRNPNVVKKPKGMDTTETGNPAVDGYTVRNRESLNDADRRNSLWGNDEDYHSESLMSEREKRMKDIYGED